MNDEQILQLTETILKEEEEFLVPIIKLYELMQSEKEFLDFEVDHLQRLIESDDKFQIIDSQSTQEPWPDEDDEEMQKLGYYKGPRVMLKEKAPSKEEMMQTVTEKMQNTLNALKSAYHVKPDNLSDDEEEEFLQIMQKVKDLQKKFDSTNKPDQEDEEI
ncbi:hypothetical protein A2533_03515 [Candidatus Falkowbacteria bacterium RIFOXYD2_FULL_35_9]|uniref:Uncharacterized protein n=1 Tax=Candidatus Falkowbacteria bacterium RIFOXYC2_FULL_36_12 TaxID=1798002 RepID=A0A1F5T0D3_9BACT|nr:MAG: hypothetical protein A2300_01435 [Candidatus Falkowbacteria bacterium RIFOXYB2_FULL_35_7]OGF32417.1 MAG: hypothetical protein A2478_03800 [Candidatus Falkowbacteria bacterium RIFOXYC2_FULL_36_12]OGF33864.1 MAG: hypothetical protein A2223_03035 [Candidatus Falkowbacteria bacterium RIFOXYA2_FULL_35_8]OGF47376.1 MAG: hypothetical protein A2533_03515 [Candidatus Falkowbacteria bacterium RIFOXYD2_FULL_35_9]